MKIRKGFVSNSSSSSFVIDSRICELPFFKNVSEDFFCEKFGNLKYKYSLKDVVEYLRIEIQYALDNGYWERAEKMDEYAGGIVRDLLENNRAVIPDWVTDKKEFKRKRKADYYEQKEYVHVMKHKLMESMFAQGLCIIEFCDEGGGCGGFMEHTVMPILAREKFEDGSPAVLNIVSNH